MDKTNQLRLHAAVHGRVQGVSFRYFVLDSARRLDLSGWVRNRYDGTVEVMAEGERDKLETLTQDLKKGSNASRVTHVDHQWSDATGEFLSFKIRMTK
jgi:acylphosphatase